MTDINKADFDNFEQLLAEVPEIIPDEWDKQMLEEIDAEIDEQTTPLEAVRAYRECSGKISVQMPKELHYKLLEGARDNGVSLNQFVVYKLAK